MTCRSESHTPANETRSSDQIVMNESFSEISYTNDAFRFAFSNRAYRVSPSFFSWPTLLATYVPTRPS